MYAFPLSLSPDFQWSRVGRSVPPNEAAWPKLVCGDIICKRRGLGKRFALGERRPRHEREHHGKGQECREKCSKELRARLACIAFSSKYLLWAILLYVTFGDHWGLSSLAIRPMAISRNALTRTPLVYAEPPSSRATVPLRAAATSCCSATRVVESIALRAHPLHLHPSPALGQECPVRYARFSGTGWP